MLLWSLLWASFAIGVVLAFGMGLANRMSPPQLRRRAIATGLTVALILGAGSFVVSFLLVIQGDSRGDSELLSSQRIQDVGYSESSTKRGDLLGNYTYELNRVDKDGASFRVSESVASAATRLYVDEDLKSARLEHRQDYWSDPAIFPWRVWSFQSYRIYSPIDPR